MPCEEKEDKDDPGVVNPTFFTDDEDDVCRGDESTASVSTRSSPDLSPSHSPSMSAPVSPRHSPVSYRSGNLSHRSSVSSVRKGILKKSGSSSTINMEMVNLGLQQNAALNAAANSASGMNGYHRSRFTDPYDECYVPVDTHRFVSAPDESSGMTQKSLGGHRVKFILETGKPDHVTGDYDDIRIEKMERERIERIERGKNLEVTNGGDKGGRKCLLFCAAMLVLTASVITAGLYGSGKLKVITNYGQSGIPNGGDGSGAGGPPGKTESYKEVFYVPNALEVRFKIENKIHNDTLSEINSPEFKNLSKELEDKLVAVIFTNEVRHNGKATLTLKIIKFEPGSIICTFRIAWTYLGDRDLGVDKSPPLNRSMVVDKLDSTFRNKDDPHFKDYVVSTESLQVSRLADKCRNNETKCSHNCVFRDESLRFECDCPDHLTLKADKLNCYSPELTSTISPTSQQTEASTTIQTITSTSFTFTAEAQETTDLSTFFTESNFRNTTDVTVPHDLTTNADFVFGTTGTDKSNNSLTTETEYTMETIVYNETEFFTETDITREMVAITEAGLASEMYSPTVMDVSSTFNTNSVSETDVTTETGILNWTDPITEWTDPITETDSNTDATTFELVSTTKTEGISTDILGYTDLNFEKDSSGWTDPPTDVDTNTTPFKVESPSVTDITVETEVLNFTDFTYETDASSSVEYTPLTDSTFDVNMVSTTQQSDLSAESYVSTEANLESSTDFTTEINVSSLTELVFKTESNKDLDPATIDPYSYSETEVVPTTDFSSTTDFTGTTEYSFETDNVTETNNLFQVQSTTEVDFSFRSINVNKTNFTSEFYFTTDNLQNEAYLTDVITESNYGVREYFTTDSPHEPFTTGFDDSGEVTSQTNLNLEEEEGNRDYSSTLLYFTAVTDLSSEADQNVETEPVTLINTATTNFTFHGNLTRNTTAIDPEEITIETENTSEPDFTTWAELDNVTIDSRTDFTLTKEIINGNGTASPTDYFTTVSYFPTVTDLSSEVEFNVETELISLTNTPLENFTFGGNLTGNTRVTDPEEITTESENTSILNFTLWELLENVTLEAETESTSSVIIDIVNGTTLPSESTRSNEIDITSRKPHTEKDLVPEKGFVPKTLFINNDTFSNADKRFHGRHLVPDTGFNSKTMFIEETRYLNDTNFTD